MPKPATIEAPGLTKRELETIPARILSWAGDTFANIVGWYRDFREAVEQQVDALPSDALRAYRDGELKTQAGVVKWSKEWVRGFKAIFRMGELPEAPVEVVVDEEAKS